MLLVVVVIHVALPVLMVTLLQGNKSGTGFRAHLLTDAGVPN